MEIELKIMVKRLGYLNLFSTRAKAKQRLWNYAYEGINI